MDEKYLTIKEVMTLTGLCRTKIHKLCEQGFIKYKQTEGKHRLISKLSVENIIAWQTEFKSIPGFPNYTISESGEIRKVVGKQAPKVLEPILNNDGYYKIGLRDKDGKRFYFTVHRLVAITYLGDYSNEGLQVNHKDENKTNNHVSNLEWCTPLYNCNYGTRNEKISNKNKKL